MYSDFLLDGYVITVQEVFVKVQTYRFSGSYFYRHTYFELDIYKLFCCKEGTATLTSTHYP